MKWADYILQDPTADQELRDVRMRYTRERDMRNENLPPDEQNIAFVPEIIRNMLARLFGRRHLKNIVWLFMFILLLLVVRICFGSPLAYFGRLPTDIQLQGPNWQFYAPIGTCILMSCLFSALSRLMGLAFPQPAQYSSHDRSGAPPPRGGFEFHGSVMFCAIQ